MVTSIDIVYAAALQVAFEKHPDYIQNDENSKLQRMTTGRGGKRVGAGRPRGERWSSPIKALRTEARALLSEIVGTERDPLLIAVEIAANPDVPLPLRVEAALGSIRYLHPALSAAAVQHVTTPRDQGAALATVLARLEQMRVPSAPLEIEGSGSELRTQDGHAVAVEAENA